MRREGGVSAQTKILSRRGAFTSKEFAIHFSVKSTRTPRSPWKCGRRQSNASNGAGGGAARRYTAVCDSFGCLLSVLPTDRPGFLFRASQGGLRGRGAQLGERMTAGLCAAAPCRQIASRSPFAVARSSFPNSDTRASTFRLLQLLRNKKSLLDFTGQHCGAEAPAEHS